MNSILQVRDSATGEWIDIPALVGPKGEPGQSGVYFGKDEPTDENVNVWVRDTDNSDNVLNFVSYTPQTLTPEQKAQARQNIGAIEAPETAEVGQTIVVKEVDENGKPTQWEAANFPAGGSNECDLLLDVTTTERVQQIIQDIEPRAYKQIVALVIASGHSDNSKDGYQVSLIVTNADGDTAEVNTQVTVAQATTIYYGRALMNLSPKYAYCTSTSNINGDNREGLGGAHKGERLYQWNTNVINRIMITSWNHTMEVGAQIKVWGYRA